MKVTIVIPNWNGADLLAESLNSLKKQSCNAHIIVVDNGSVDKSVAIVEELFPDVQLIRLPQNTGFAGGVNAGIRVAMEQGADWIALFNNDAVAQKDWLKHLVETIGGDEKIGIVSCKQLRTDKKHIDSTGDCYSIWGMPFPRGRNQIDKGQYNTRELIFSAPAGATLYRAKMFKDVGLFDEAFFAYLEDVDISFRAQLAGWKIVYQPKAEMYHHVSATGSKLGSFTRYHYIKNFYLLYAKNMPGWLYWKYLPLFAIQAARLFASALLKGGSWAYVRGMTRAIWLTPHIIRERRHIQKGRRVAPGSIDAGLYRKRPPKIPIFSA